MKIKWYQRCRIGEQLTLEHINFLSRFNSEEEFDKFMSDDCGYWAWYGYKVNSKKLTIGKTCQDYFEDKISSRQLEMRFNYE